jgi:Flp pilus assembly protein TadG
VQVYLLRLWTDLQRLARDTNGASAVEFALIAPALCVLVAGAIDTGLLLVRTMEVNAAAQAGADFALNRGWDAAGIQNAVTSATGSSVITAPAPTLTSGCVVSGVVAAPTGALCANGAPPGNYVTASAEAPFSPIAPWPGIDLPNRLTSQARVRIE